jgi:hypothetical protein
VSATRKKVPWNYEHTLPGEFAKLVIIHRLLEKCMFTLARKLIVLKIRIL